MSPRDIGIITNKVKAEIERESWQLEGKVDYDIKSKSKTTQAIKLFSEGKTPIGVVIVLDLPADEVRAIFREYWELKGMHTLDAVYTDYCNFSFPGSNGSQSWSGSFNTESFHVRT